jgi:NAD(P)-dependent dehydrogenase (short-subunit alcohol dehydrogenase family)
MVEYCDGLPSAHVTLVPFRCAEVMSRFVGRNALVTGAGSGIGAACAVALASEGASVWCADLNHAAADATARQITQTAHSAYAIALDVTVEHSWVSALAAVGPIDILVHAAGISAGSPIADTTFDEWRRVISVNLDGSFLSMKYGVRALRDRGGSITVIASASGVRAAAGAAAYSSSKAAVRMLAQVVAKECRTSTHPIRVNTVSPAGVKTPMWSGMPFFQEMIARLGTEEAAYAELSANTGGSRFATPEQIAIAVCYLASDDASMITGTDLVIDDGYTI